MDLAALDRSHEVDWDEVVQAACSRILFGQLDLTFVDVIDCADVRSVRTDHLGMLLDLRDINHRFHSLLSSRNRCPNGDVPAQLAGPE